MSEPKDPLSAYQEFRARIVASLSRSEPEPPDREWLTGLLKQLDEGWEEFCSGYYPPTLCDWPAWARQAPVVTLTQAELDALPEYSCTLPDSYKRPVAEGGRPWKRDLNFYSRFEWFTREPKWVRCEYVPDPHPKFLAIKSERIELVPQTFQATCRGCGWSDLFPAGAKKLSKRIQARHDAHGQAAGTSHSCRSFTFGVVIQNPLEKRVNQWVH